MAKRKQPKANPTPTKVKTIGTVKPKKALGAKIASKKKVTKEVKKVNISTTMDRRYEINVDNWYTSKPYGFRATSRGNKEMTMFLPISPSNLTITTNFATNIIPTLYGTVEEHSDVRYYDISITGTTGFAPRFVEPIESEGASTGNVRHDGRKGFHVIDKPFTAGGFFSKTLSVLNQLKTKATSLYDDIVNGAPKTEIGFTAGVSGYAAFHNLYRFLLVYKKDAAGVSGSTAGRKRHPLTFFNHKDNNEYDVAIKTFTLTRSADNPMLYNYNIQLRGYNLRTASKKNAERDETEKRLSDLGLNGVDGSSVLGNIRTKSNQAKGIIGGLVGGINILGR